MLQGIAAAFLIRIPVAYIMCQMTGRLFYIGLGIPCSTVFQILACFLYFRKVRRDHMVTAAPVPEENEDLLGVTAGRVVTAGVTAGRGPVTFLAGRDSVTF